MRGIEARPLQRAQQQEGVRFRILDQQDTEWPLESRDIRISIHRSVTAIPPRQGTFSTSAWQGRCSSNVTRFGEKSYGVVPLCRLVRSLLRRPSNVSRLRHAPSYWLDSYLPDLRQAA